MSYYTDLIDERNRREQSRRASKFAAVAEATPSVEPPDDDGGFFGGITRSVGGAAKAAGGFFGGIVHSIADPIGDVVKAGAGEVEELIQGPIANRRIKEANEMRKKLQADLDSGGIDLKKYNERMKDLKAFQEKTSQIVQNKNLEESDQKKVGAAGVQTLINIGTLGGGTAAKAVLQETGKQVLKSGGTKAATEVLESNIKKTAVKQAEKAAANRTAKGASKTIAKNAGVGAAITAPFAALEPIRKQGDDASPEDVWQAGLTGGLFGAAGGAGLSMLDRNVRAGTKQIPAATGQAVRDSTGQLVTQQAGHIQIPGRGVNDALTPSSNRPAAELQKQLEDAWNTNDLPAAQKIIDEMPVDLKAPMQGMQDYKVKAGTKLDSASAGADAARKQLMPDTPIPTDDLIHSSVAQYSNAEQFINETAKRAVEAEKSVKGGQMVRNGDDGFKRISEHAPWYSNLYRETGKKPTQAEVRDLVEESLNKGRDPGGLIHPEESSIYQLLKQKEGAPDIPTGPIDMSEQFMADLGVPGAKPSGARARSALPAGPGADQFPLDVALQRRQVFDDPTDIQAALGRMESKDNPTLDYVAPARPGAVGEQATLVEANPYAGAKPDFSLPTLPAGPTKTVSPQAAKARFKKDGEVVEVLNRQRPGKDVTQLPANMDEVSNIAVRQTPAGKVKPLANNNAHITRDDVDAIRAIADDDTGTAFTSTRTPEMNLEEATIKRGGVKSKEFKTLDKFNTSIREHTANFTRDVQDKRDFMERFIKEYGINGKNADDMRPFLETASKEDSEQLLQQYIAAHGKKAGEGLVRLRKWWRSTKDQVRNETNEQIVKYAGEKRAMGDLGETYVPRVYKAGARGFKDTVFDTAHAGMDKIGGKNGMFNLETGTGYLSKETESMGGILRNSEGIPLNSEMAKPNTTYLSAAQKRTAKDPIQELEDPLTSMMRYFESTGRAKHFTEDIARGRTLQKAIEYVNNDTGNLRQMYKSFDDQINAVAGKTSRIDRPIVDNKTGAKIVNIASKLQSRIARSTILGSTTSAMAQTGNLPLAMAEAGPKNFKKGMSDMIRALRSKADDPMGQSALMTTRYPAHENLFAVKTRTKMANKATNVVAKPFRVIEKAATELAWRSSYNHALSTGLKGKAAVQDADRMAAKIVGERSPGARAALYESKALGPVSSYTLEVNQLYQTAKQYFKRDPKKAAALVGAIWVYNQGYKAVTGNKLNADPLQAALDAGELLTSDEFVGDDGLPIGMGERLVRAGGRIAGETVDATPLGGPVVGQLYPEQGFKVPFSGGDRVMSRADIFGGTNLGRYGGGTPIASGIGNPLLMLGVPGAGQLQRSVEGNKAFNAGASITPGGNTRFNIEQDPENYWRSILLGMYSTKEGRAYLAAQNARLQGQTGQ